MAEEAIKNNDSVQDQWGQICSQLKIQRRRYEHLRSDPLYEKLGYHSLQ